MATVERGTATGPAAEANVKRVRITLLGAGVPADGGNGGGAGAAFDLRRMESTPTEPHAMRAFGYFFDKPAFNQRMINHSAVVARALSR